MHSRREDQRDGRTGAGEKCARQAEVNGLPELLKQSLARFSRSCRDVRVHCNGGEGCLAALCKRVNGLWLRTTRSRTEKISSRTIPSFAIGGAQTRRWFLIRQSLLFSRIRYFRRFRVAPHATSLRSMIG